MSTMKYKGYVAKIEYDPDLEMFCGTVINSSSHTFYGESVDALKKEFAITIEEYLKVCQEKGQDPKPPYSGRFNLRIPPDLHGMIAINAKNDGKSINRWIKDVLENHVTISQH